MVSERLHLRVRPVFDGSCGKLIHKCGKYCGKREKRLFIACQAQRLKWCRRLLDTASTRRFSNMLYVDCCVDERIVKG